MITKRTSLVSRALAVVLAAAVFGAAHAATPMISSVNGHVLALRSDGAVFGWGSDVDGALATGRALYSATASVIPDLPPIKDVSAFERHVVALDRSGRVWTWGDNNWAQLGIRVQRNATKPGRVSGISDVQSVAAGGLNSVALRTDGRVWIWGNGDPVPHQVAGLDSVVEIASGSHHVLARRSDGTVWAFGSNEYGQLGSGGFGSTTGYYAPTRVVGLANVVSIAGGFGYSIAVTADGGVWYWGRICIVNNSGEGFTVPQRATGIPQPAVKAGQGNYAILQDGSVWTIPCASGQVPQVVAGLSNVVETASGHSFGGTDTGLARTRDGKLYAMTENQSGEAGIGNTTNLAGVPTLVPLPSSVTRVTSGAKSVLAVTADGKLWTWGRNAWGSLALGEQLQYAAPVRIAGLPSDVAEVAAGLSNSMARTQSGNVWAWGSNASGSFGDGTRTPRNAPVQVPIAGVSQISLFGTALFLKSNGEVWYSGVTPFAQALTPTRQSGLPPARAVAVGPGGAFAIDVDGALWAWGQNSYGVLGDGTRNPAPLPVKITAISGKVVQVVSHYYVSAALTEDGSVWTWGDNYWGQLGDPSATSRPLPQKVPGLANVAEIAASQFHILARLSDGTLVSWGCCGDIALGRDSDWGSPGPVLGIDSVARIAVGFAFSAALRTDGTVWAWGKNCESSCPSVGDGTYVPRRRPVVVVAENGRGNTDTNDWFLDLKPGTPKTIPPDKVPRFVPVVKSLSGSSLLNYDASVGLRKSDQAKTVGLYVLGLVPPAFLKQVPTAPGAHALAANAKADAPILVNLTPSGWTVVSGQISALTTGVNSAFLGATGLLTNVNPATIPGARFCIGYGESATDMLRTETIRDFLALEGATSSALGLPCLLSGVYVDGPPTSQKGIAVPLRGVVVGQSPTGSVWFRDKFSDISAPITVSARNAAVSDVTTTYTPPNPGEYAFLARYGGDSLNAATTSEIALRHVVAAVQTQQTTTRIDAPVSSEIGMEIRLMAVVSGNRPTGSVQFKRGAVNEGTPVPVINDQAVTTVVGLGLGDYSFTASYSGDAANQPSTSVAYAHKVLDVATSAVALGSSANPSGLGDAITLTATVTGTNPTGTVQLREGVSAIGNPVALSGGKATFALPSLTAGIHVFTVDYAGDVTNPKATSNPVFQQVNLNLNPTGDLDGDGIPNAVEQQENLRPDVKDNDVFANPRLFAMQQYRDFLGREGDAAGVSFWANQLSSNAKSRAQMVESYFKSPEFQGSASPVVRLYFAYFLRIPDYDGLNYWIGQYRAGTPLQSISNAFVQSAEFANRYGALNSTQFVNLVYSNVLGRSADAAGLAYWKGQLDTNAMTRGQVTAAFSESPEYTALSTSSVYVTMMYAAMLRRSPDASGFAFWVDYLDKGNSGAALINGFLAVPEYRQRFLP